MVSVKQFENIKAFEVTANIIYIKNKSVCLSDIKRIGRRVRTTEIIRESLKLLYS